MIKQFTTFFLMFSTVSMVAVASNLQDVLSHTYQNSLTINSARAGLKATDESINTAKAGYRPQIKALASIGRSYSKLNYTPGVYAEDESKMYRTPDSLGAQVVQPIFSGFSTVNTVKSAEETIRLERENLYNTEQITLLNATFAYMNVIRDRAVLELQENNEKILTKHLESYQKKFKAGELTKTDVAQSQARVSGAKAATIEAKGQLKVSNAQYVSVTGLDVTDKMDDVIVNEALLPKSLEEAIETAMQHNPQLKASESAFKSSKYNVSAKKGALSPVVDMQASAYKSHNSGVIDESNTWDVSANLSIPIYQSGAEYASIRSAKHTANQMRIMVAKMKADVRSETISAYENYESAKAALNAVKEQIKASKIALQGVIREEGVGTRTVLDVLDAEQEHLDNQVAFVKIHRDKVVAAYTLLADIGALNPVHLNLSVEKYDPKANYNKIKNKWF